MPFDPQKLSTFPTQPGVYLMKGRDDTVLYVGKAKNLRQRIRQYFVPGGDGRPQLPFLVPKIEEIETIVVTSEKEALILENNLIKKHWPKYNALLKDDKSYIALKITNDAWPRVDVVRYRGQPEPDGRYFGPYTNAFAARRTLDLLHRLFPMRQCSDAEFARRKRPCILYDMKLCIAPCVGLCTHEEYDMLVDRTVLFLRGQNKEILKDLYHEMEQYAENLEFEKAHELLNTIRQIEKTIEGQRVDIPFGADADVLGIYRQGDEVILSQLYFRSGRLTGSRHYDFERIAEDDAELLRNFLIQQYERQIDVPSEILLPITLDDADAISELISVNRKKKVHVNTPQRGIKHNLVDMAFLNAEATFKKEKDEKTIRERTLLEMQEKLRLTTYPARIECFDNSCLAGDQPVSVMVAFTDGLKDKSRYRKYKLRSVTGMDDYGSLREVLLRRYGRAKEEDNLPNLLIVDGGKGHLNVAIKVMNELNIVTVNLIGVAKEDARHDKGLTSEQVFLPNVKDPIFLNRTSPILFLIQQIRDEAHRFALTFQKKRRSMLLTKSSLEEIPGIGPVKRKRLLKHFGSLKRIKDASEEDLQKISGLNKKDIEAILKLKSVNVDVDLKDVDLDRNGLDGLDGQ